MRIRWVTVVFFQLVALTLFAQTPTPTQSETDAKLIESLRERANTLQERISTLQEQQTTLRNRLRQEEKRSRQVEERLAVAEKAIENRNDSISRYIQAASDLNAQLVQVQTARREAEAARARVEVVRDTAIAKVARLTYERNLLTVSDLIRIYRVAPSETLTMLLRNLDETESGFQYNVDSTANELKIIRHFDDKTEAWWLFDKTLDTILELTLQFKRHRFDRNRTLVMANSRLLQKIRYSNKPFEEQSDVEKIALYRDKTLKLVEGTLRKYSDK